jgi:3-hydroxypropanoate dehydrogenase
VTLPDQCLDQIFRTAHTVSGFRDEPVTDATLRALWDLTKWGPTTLNSSPGRFVFVRSAVAKAKLAPALSAGNHDKTMKAPCTVIVAYDLEFHEKLGKLFPHIDGRALFVGKPDHTHTTAFRNGTLQGGYLIVAARALGLDCGPMSGFDNAKVDAAFFEGSSWRSNFLVNLGYGDPSKVRPRGPRLEFDEACRIE